MSDITGPAVAVGAITLANTWVFRPIASGGNIDVTTGWRIIPGTAVFAVLMNGLDRLSPMLAKAIVITAMVTVILEPNGAVVNLAKALGYQA